MRKLKMFDIIYIKNVSRFSRNAEEGLRLIRDFREYDVEIYFEDASISTKDPSMDMVVNMLFSLAEKESTDKSKAVRDGLRESEKRGGWHRLPPYGYNMKGGFLNRVEPELDVVKRIYNYYLYDQLGMNKIATILNNEGIPTKKGFKWQNFQIQSILSNRIYVGDIITHIEETTNVMRKTRKKTDEPNLFHNEELRVIDDEKFNKVQALKTRKYELMENDFRPSSVNIFSNLLRCGNCGATHRKKVRKAKVSGIKRYEYVCTNKDQYGNSICQHRNMISELDLIEKVKQEIITLRERDMSSLLNLYKALYYNYDISPTKLEELRVQERKIIRRIDMNFDEYSDQEISKEEYSRRRVDLNNRLLDIREQINKIIYYDREIQTLNKRYDDFKKELNNIDLDNLTNAQLKRIFSKIVIKTYERMGNPEKIIYYSYTFLDKSLDEIIEDVKKSDFKIEIA